jgi:hypothetical protein
MSFSWRSLLSFGIKLLFCITYALLDGCDSIVLNDIKANVQVSEAKFGRPAPLKARQSVSSCSYLPGLRGVI